MKFRSQIIILMKKNIALKMKKNNNIDSTDIINYDFCIKCKKKKKEIKSNL